MLSRWRKEAQKKKDRVRKRKEKQRKKERPHGGVARKNNKGIFLGVILKLLSGSYIKHSKTEQKKKLVDPAGLEPTTRRL